MINGFHHVAMRAKDFDKSIEFYTDGLGFKETNRWEMKDGKRAVMIDTGNDNYLEIFEGRENEVSEGSYIHLAFTTDDCNKSLEMAKNAGAEITMEPQNIDINSDPVLPVRVAFCKGPDSEIIEFFQIRT